MNTNDSALRTILAGGGLVQNERNEVLFMFRRNVWDLPKGKLDDGESLEDCALREVEEETGLQKLALKELLIVTRHRYEENGQPTIKETHWYRMTAPADQPLIPQLEEDITELAWIPETGFSRVKANTFPTILDVLKAAGYRVS